MIGRNDPCSFASPLGGILLALCCAIPGSASATPEARAAQSPVYIARSFSRKTIYHSPQNPGYTSWVGAWQMPDHSLMVCFTQATGPITERSHAPAGLIKRLGLPDEGWDFTGLDRREIYLRSADRGAHWTQVSASPFGGVGASAYAGGATVVLPDGAILRRVNGWDLMGEPAIPPTAYLQRSDDGARTWGPPQVLLDPSKVLYQIGRMRRLQDGRIVATGQLWPIPATSSHAQISKTVPQLLVMTSGDSGKTWARREVVPPQHRDVMWDEWDWAELPGGDLLCVFRRGDPANRRREVRWQGILKKKGDGWTLSDFGPSALPHSGHPELLATREGMVLYFATTGVEWTADSGDTWHPLKVPGFPNYKSRYYPRSLQVDDGTIYVFGHNGWDNRYGEFDQSIDMDSFQLVRE